MTNECDQILKDERIKKYRQILSELEGTGFDIKGVLEGAYGYLDVFEASPTLQQMAIDRLELELRYDVRAKPLSYVVREYMRLDLNIVDLVEDVLRDINIYRRRGEL
jgi:hypothetical protein